MPYTKRPKRARALCASVLAAGLLSTALPALASACPSSPTSHPFAAIGDGASYTLVHGGTFEGGAPEWTIANSEIVAEEVAVTHTRAALALGSWARAVSAPFCASSEDPTFRFMDRLRRGSGRLYVGLLWRDASGAEHEATVGSLAPAGSWSASPVMALAANLPLSAGSSLEPVRLTFETHERGLSVAISDVFIDPYSR